MPRCALLLALIVPRCFAARDRFNPNAETALPNAALRKACTYVPARTPPAKPLADVLPPTPLMAHRHSYCTSTMRVLDAPSAWSQEWN
jgi:hypothetical protein